jgi:hypothetical protein
MSIESRVPDEISARVECPPEPDGNSPCVCQLPNGTKIVTTTAECKGLGGTPMVKTLPRHLMIPYTLPSGNEVVGNYEDFLTDGGRLVDAVDLSETDPSEIRPNGRVLCKLPSGLGIVETRDEYLADGGMIVGRIRRQRS